MPRLSLLFRHASTASANTSGRINDLNAVFAPAGMAFNSANVSAQSGLGEVNVGLCRLGSGPSSTVRSLFDQVTLGASQAVVFLVERLISANPGTTGCSSHPPAKPGVVVRRTAGRWILAHEIGHMLGLGHAEDGLMRSDPSQLSDNEIPRLLPGQVAALAQPRVFSVTGVLEPDLVTTVEALRVRAKRTARRRPERVAVSLNDRSRELVARALHRMKRPRTADILNRVAEVIEQRPELLREYKTLRRSLGTAVLHRQIGNETRKRTRMVSTGQRVRGSSLLKRYALSRKSKAR